MVMMTCDVVCRVEEGRATAARRWRRGNQMIIVIVINGLVPWTWLHAGDNNNNNGLVTPSTAYVQTWQQNAWHRNQNYSLGSSNTHTHCCCCTQETGEAMRTLTTTTALVHYNNKTNLPQLHWQEHDCYYCCYSQGHCYYCNCINRYYDHGLEPPATALLAPASHPVGNVGQTLDTS